jgi:hypothetical protein
MTGLKILKCVIISQADPAFLKCPEPYTAGFLTEEMLRKFAQDPGTYLSEEWIERARLHGDECLGICDGETLAAYGWYAHKPVPIDPEDILLYFNNDYVYMYAGFTRPEYRGQRLHGIGMSLALQHYLNRGYKGLVSCIESHNFDSLKSSLRMGYVEFGTLYILKLLGHYFLHASRGCEKYGYYLKPVDLLEENPANSADREAPLR